MDAMRASGPEHRADGTPDCRRGERIVGARHNLSASVPRRLARTATSRISRLALGALLACGGSADAGGDGSTLGRGDDAAAGFDSASDFDVPEPEDTGTRDPDGAVPTDTRPDDGGSAGARPNIVVIMADDLDQGSLETMLARGLAPNIRTHIAEPGVRFANTFAPNALCCPSRAMFLTGQYSHNTGVLTNHLPNGTVARFRDASSIATWLRAAGYRTGHVGKYLNGYGSETAPTYVPPGWDDWQATIGGSTYRMYNYDVNDNGRVVHYGTAPADYQTDVLAKRAVDFINESDARHDAAPFFLVVTPLAPHTEADNPLNLPFGSVRPAPRHVGRVTLPLPQPPSFGQAPAAQGDASWSLSWIRDRAYSTDDVAAIQALYRGRIGAMMAVDDLVGDVVAALRRTGELENTVLVFMADNGYSLGEHRLVTKRVPYEESVRVPLIIRAPGVTGNRSVARLVAMEDLAPTFAALASVTPRLTVDGRSLVPLLRGQNPGTWRDRVLLEQWYHPDETAARDLATYVGVRTAPGAAMLPDRKFLRYPMVPTREYYDLNDDPYERSSRHAVAARASEISTLGTMLDALKSCAGASCRRAEDP